MQRIRAAQEERLAAMQEAQGLPRVRRAMSTLFNARVGESEVRRLTDFLPDVLDNSGNRLIRQAQVALAAYKAGLSVSVNLSTGGFDTHGNHDANHIPRLQALLEGVDFVMEEAQRLDIADKVVVAVGSDFGRTPRYNDGNGKDHWSITSMMMMGAGVPGNRVVGSTTDEHRAINVDPSSLAPSEGGIRLKPDHVQSALRRLAGIEDHELSTQYAISGGDEVDILA
jgi:uncharacterized protein (DUF1501 family)